MHTKTQCFINDLEKFRKKFPFPFKSENDDFLSVYQRTIEEIQSFCETEFDWFKSDKNEVKTTFKKTHDLTYKVIQSKLDDDDETAIGNFNELMKSSNNRNLSFDSFLPLDQKDFFRIRRSNCKDGKRLPFTKEDLFHIKYFERRKCRNYRFSISGTPALYLGESIELCEEETFNGDTISEYYISKFRSRDSFKVITIDFPEFVIWRLNHDGDYFSALRFLAFLPFTRSCLFKTAPPHNHPYNPEYIVPQMLMSYIKKIKKYGGKETMKYDGVRFPSTKLTYDAITKPVLNYAFPVMDPDEDGFCKNLKRIFGWTDPVASEIDYAKMKSILCKGVEEIEMSENLKNIRAVFGHKI
ncbi:hypothetical protein [Echinicola rosea]|uniref:RES domain-containing protein n=1 Tax=Echinicola rosea TaxID=1807691 RepID=A0ABQ1VB77_9BACT|nr:hypothetical protein [Echinicola rosea]GGF49021.1 hypothetical protein GCM10011339_42070 [Echinicola rosea]